MKRFTKIITCTLTVAVCVSLGLVIFGKDSQVHAAEGDVVINEKNFPDDNFREWVSQNADTSSDGVLSSSEIQSVKNINCSDCGIADLTGIKTFKNLTYLNCRDNILEELDVSGMVFLENFEANNNIISKVNASGCKKLHFPGNYGTEPRMRESTPNNVYGTQPLAGNRLYSIDFSGCISLEIYIDYHNETLTESDFSGCTSLTWLELNNKQIEKLNIKNCSNLKKLYINENNLETLDFSGCKNLREVEINNNKFTTLDFSPCTNLESLQCILNSFSKLDVSKNKLLKKLYCRNNQLETLDVSNHVALVDFSCRNNKITDLNLSECKKITDLSLISENNPLKSLNLSDCVSLKSFDIGGTTLSSVDLSGCSGLTTVDLSNNQLEKLTLTGCDHLQDLNVYNNNLKTLDISACSRLEKLDCRYNYLKEKNTKSGLVNKYIPQNITEKAQGLSAKDIDDRSITLKWDSAKGNYIYQLSKKSITENYYYVIYEGTDTEFKDDEHLDPETTYYYKICLWMEEDGKSASGPESEILEVTTKAEVINTDPIESTPTDVDSQPTVTNTPTATPTPAQVSGPAPVGTTINVGGASYIISKEGEVTYTGSEDKKEIEIPATISDERNVYKVTSIGKKAFYGFKKLEVIKGGSSVKEIGEQAFANCPKLKTFKISSKQLKTIGAKCFKGDKKLKSIVINKTTKLTAAGIKKSLAGSKIKTVKVAKKKVKSYKKIFSKKTCGIKVTVTK